MAALDIDGTLVPDTTIDMPSETRHAVDEARRLGHEIVLASGRSLAGILPIARGLGITDGWVVASNGAVIARLTATSPGFTLGVRDVQTLAAFSTITAALDARLPGLQIAVEKIGRGYRVNNPFPKGLLNGEQKILPLHQLRAMASPRIVLRAAGVPLLTETLRSMGLTVHVAGNDWIDVTPGGVSKATALETVRQRLGIDRAGTLAVGDGLNDLQMLAWAGRGVAMGHAPSEVIEAADEVTGTLEEHGAAQVLRALARQSVAAGR